MSKLLLLLKMLVAFPIRIFGIVSPFAIIRNSKLSKESAVSAFCNIYCSEIGKFSYIGKNTSVYHTKIGNFTSIADGCIIGPGSHPVNKLSTSPVFYSKRNIFGFCFAESHFVDYEETWIGNDVWIGTHVFIKGGVKIGNGAILGAYSVVTKDVEPFTIVAGNPAKLIRNRFEDESVKEIISKEWWNWSNEKISDNIDLFI